MHDNAIFASRGDHLRPAPLLAALLGAHLLLGSQFICNARLTRRFHWNDNNWISETFSRLSSSIKRPVVSHSTGVDGVRVKALKRLAWPQRLQAAGGGAVVATADAEDRAVDFVARVVFVCLPSVIFVTIPVVYYSGHARRHTKA